MSAIAARVIDNLQSYHDSKRDTEKQRQSRRSAHELYEVDVKLRILAMVRAKNLTAHMLTYRME